MPAWPLSPVKAITSKPVKSFIDMTLLEEEEEEDEDYDPEKEPPHNSDDEESIVSSQTSDIGSPIAHKLASLRQDTSTPQHVMEDQLTMVGWLALHHKDNSHNSISNAEFTLLYRTFNCSNACTILAHIQGL